MQIRGGNLLGEPHRDFPVVPRRKLRIGEKKGMGGGQQVAVQARSLERAPPSPASTTLRGVLALGDKTPVL